MTDTTEYRIEHDTMGEVRVPKDALYAAQTQRAVENFPISGTGLESTQIAALARIKKAAALANKELGTLDAEGVPLDPIRAFAAPTGAAAGAASSVRRPQRTGRECPECHNPTLAKVDGCDQCGSCGWIGSCG